MIGHGRLLSGVTTTAVTSSMQDLAGDGQNDPDQHAECKDEAYRTSACNERLSSRIRLSGRKRYWKEARCDLSKRSLHRALNVNGAARG
jgi:hypothetical protein